MAFDIQSFFVFQCMTGFVTDTRTRSNAKNYLALRFGCQGKGTFVPSQAVKAYGRSGDIAPFILSLGTRRR